MVHSEFTQNLLSSKYFTTLLLVNLQYIWHYRFTGSKFSVHYRKGTVRILSCNLGNDSINAL